MKAKKICIECGKDVMTCDDRFDMYGDGKPMEKNVKMIWGNAWKLSKELTEGNK